MVRDRPSPLARPLGRPARAHGGACQPRRLAALALLVAAAIAPGGCRRESLAWQPEAAVAREAAEPDPAATEPPARTGPSFPAPARKPAMAGLPAANDAVPDAPGEAAPERPSTEGGGARVGPVTVAPAPAAPAAALANSQADIARHTQLGDALLACRRRCETSSDVSPTDRFTCGQNCVNEVLPASTGTASCERACLRTANDCLDPCSGRGSDGATCGLTCRDTAVSCMNRCPLAGRPSGE